MSVTPVTAWPVPPPATLFNNAATVYETNPALTGIDARSSFSVAATNCRIVAMTGYDLYLYQGNLALELMPDTAQLWLSRHANIWGVPQIQPTPATGNAIFSSTGVQDVIIPRGTVLTAPAGWTYITTAAITIGAGTLTGTAPISSSLGGSAYNLPGGSPLQLLNVITGLSSQNAVLDSNGAANGADLETPTHWRGRILQKIRTPAQAGAGSDYVAWAQAAGAAYVTVVPNAIGPGSVGVFIVGPGPSVATTQLVNAVQNYIGVYGTASGVRPVTANVQVQAASALNVGVSVHLADDSVQNEAAVNAAVIAAFAALPQVGNAAIQLYVGQLDGAIANALNGSGFDLVTPTADVIPTSSQFLKLQGGAVTFV